MRTSARYHLILLGLSFASSFSQTRLPDDSLRINEQGYFEMPGLNVMLFNDFYPEGHQGGLTIIHYGRRVAANGDLRLEPAPGQWSPVPKVGGKHVDAGSGTITVTLWYPDSSRNRRGFNPIDYPDLTFTYTVRAEARGAGITLTVDLEKPLPDSWARRVGFNLELFPGEFFGRHYLMDGKPGLFPRQANGPMVSDSAQGGLQMLPLASGRRLVIAPSDDERQITIESSGERLQLIDGRALYNNGWFILRSTIPPGASRGAVVWTIVPSVRPLWRRAPVVQVSQAGYHPAQKKIALVELDRLTSVFEPVRLIRLAPDTEIVVKMDPSPALWGMFLRYEYLKFDFSDVTREGIYRVEYGPSRSAEFEIARDVFARHVWQPTLEYFLPVQMCHMRINDRYKVWHGLCHMDDARMAPLNYNHLDGYFQGASSLTKYAPLEHIPGVNIGGWHDAGDYDIRVESQAETVYRLSQAYELFGENYDATSIDQQTRVVELHVPDGKPDILQQMEHGLLSIVGGYRSLGRLYRGMISPTLRQYVHLGDAATMSDNVVYSDTGRDPLFHLPLPNDDRLLFTEENPRRELEVAKTLAAAARVLSRFHPDLAGESLTIASELYHRNPSGPARGRLNAACELYLTTSEKEYESAILESRDLITRSISDYREVIGRVSRKLNRPAFTALIRDAVRVHAAKVAQDQRNPYGVPYRPRIWGAGWEIEAFGVGELFLALDFPDLVTPESALNALNFVLGCHPGENTASFASGVGARSLTVAYGANRDEWSYIPGGVSSGTALIRPDFPELKTWPYLWQQTEYVMGGGATDFILLAMAADRLLNR
jgi:endoglucanase